MFLSAAAAAVFFPEAGAQTQTATITLSPQDTFLNVDANVYATNPTLNLYTWPDYQPANAILMKFNLSSLPAGAEIQKAVLRLSLVQADTRNSSYSVTAHKVMGKNPNIAQATGRSAGSTAWTASGCCYEGIPLAQSDISPSYVTASVARTTGAYSWTITDMVKEWLADPATNFGLLLNADSSKTKDAFRYFASMEHSNAALRPVLEITYAGGDTTPPTVNVTSPASGASISGATTLTATASDPSGIAGVQFLLDGKAIGSEITSAPYSMNWTPAGVTAGQHVIAARARDNANNTSTSAGVNVTISVSNGVLTLSPADTTLNVDATNYSKATTLATYTWPDRTIANAIVLKFAIPALPAGAVIQNATLQMSLVESDRSSDPTYTIAAHKILNRNVVVEAATGSTYNGTSRWTASTCCYNSIPLAQSDISTPFDQQAIDKTPGVKTWTVTNLVQEWVADPSSNFGLLLNSDKSKPKDRYRYFASMENPNASLRPTLRIQYSATGGPVEPPEPPPTQPPPTGSVDTTPPTVSVTAPAGGATVSGTSTQITATASDNVGVAGVQFQIDGANLGSEDVSAPYSTTWNTTTTSNGSHTVTAVARDAAGNRQTASVTVTVSNTTTPPPTGGGGIAARYPGDVGIEKDPAVIFVENFEEATMNEIFNRWGDVRNGSAMQRPSDVPSGSPGGRSLSIPWVGGGVNTGGHLYKVLNPAVTDVVYVRYYIKYPVGGNFHHTGIWIGGNNPVSAWPDPGAGARPTGSDKFIASAEQNNVTKLFDHYDYYYNMRPDNGGTYWGNFLLNNPAIQAPRNAWACVEHMVKLNNPVSASNGEHAIWLNGTKVSHLGQGFPNGSWQGGIFTQGAGSTPFEGFRWRTSTSLNINWIWLQNYSPNERAGYSSTILYDHVVVAREYIGCLR
jgi:YD repeat-containing protein